jgi:hypothetical protein
MARGVTRMPQEGTSVPATGRNRPHYGPTNIWWLPIEAISFQMFLVKEAFRSVISWRLLWREFPSAPGRKWSVGAAASEEFPLSAGPFRTGGAVENDG